RSYNLFYHCDDRGTMSTGDKLGNPKFVNAAAGDFRLSSDSVAINKGTDVGYPYIGSAPDMGAYEFGEGRTASSVAALLAMTDGYVDCENFIAASYSGLYRDDVVYLTDRNRVRGVKAVTAQGITGLFTGDVISFGGVLSTEADGTRCVTITDVKARTGGPAPVPFTVLTPEKGIRPETALAKAISKVAQVTSDGYVLANGTVIDLTKTTLTVPRTRFVNETVSVIGIGETKDGVYTIYPRTAKDIVYHSETTTEKAKINNFRQRYFASGNVPFSFKYGGASSDTLLPGWNKTETVETPDDVSVKRTTTYTDPATGLEVKMVAVDYGDFPFTEWTVYFTNKGASDTPLLTNILAFNGSIVRDSAKEFVLNTNRGSFLAVNEYEPLRTVMDPYRTVAYNPSGGRPTQNYLPNYNIEYNDGGMIMVVGWPGEWQTNFSRDAENTLYITAGQQTTNFYLKPGETARTPRIVAGFYNGDRQDGQNRWRRWMMAHNMPHPYGELPRPLHVACSSSFYNEMLNANTENQMYFIRRFVEEDLDLDYWWMDAGWYWNTGTWTATGTWEVDTNRFPNGLREISDYGRSLGVKTIVWFEPERVGWNQSWISQNHPDWVLGSTSWGLLDLSNPDALDWLKHHIDNVITEQGIDLYRQDFNIDPLNYWLGKDAANRKGMTENLYIQGYLSYWDYLLERHPHMLIDSCASGGRRNDIETMRRAVPLLRSDHHTVLGDQNQTYGFASWYPFFGTGQTAFNDYDFTSTMTVSINNVLDMRDPNLPYDALRRMLRTWRFLSPNYYGDFYQLTEYGSDENVWMAWQFNTPERKTGMVQAFRRGNAPGDQLTLHLRDIDESATYTLTYYGPTEFTQTIRGSELAKGLTITQSPRTNALIGYSWE
ncbi:MAG: alpha-galactosidase, partial [Abditibacteriota bacterium]|nr:alpha-galactosidase [Abditibacteriota bacterium]